MIKTHKGYCIIRTSLKNDRVNGLRFIPAFICPDYKIAIHKSKEDNGYTITDMSTGLSVLTYPTLKAARNAIENGKYFDVINKYIAVHYGSYNHKKEQFNNLIQEHHDSLYKGDYKIIFDFNDINNKYYW